jgi:uncharacterized metal-binding protein
MRMVLKIDIKAYSEKTICQVFLSFFFWPGVYVNTHRQWTHTPPLVGASMKKTYLRHKTGCTFPAG